MKIYHIVFIGLFFFGCQNNQKAQENKKRLEVIEMTTNQLKDNERIVTAIKRETEEGGNRKEDLGLLRKCQWYYTTSNKMIEELISDTATKKIGEGDIEKLQKEYDSYYQHRVVEKATDSLYVHQYKKAPLNKYEQVSGAYEYSLMQRDYLTMLLKHIKKRAFLSKEMTLSVLKEKEGNRIRWHVLIMKTGTCSFSDVNGYSYQCISPNVDWTKETYGDIVELSFSCDKGINPILNVYRESVNPKAAYSSQSKYYRLAQLVKK